MIVGLSGPALDRGGRDRLARRVGADHSEGSLTREVFHLALGR